MSGLVSWIQSNGIGDVASVAGVLISVGGFIATLIAVYKAKSAAQQAREAARAARDGIRMFDTLVDFSAAIAAFDEIQRLHRVGDAWPTLLERYAMVRKLLVQLRNSNVLLNDEQKSVIQNALVNIVDIQEQVEKLVATPTSLKPAKFNIILSDDVDGLIAVLTQLKVQGSGG